MWLKHFVKFGSLATLILALTLSYPGGAISIYPIIVIAIVATVPLFRGGSGVTADSRRPSIIFVSAFLLLAIAFVLSARTPVDVIYTLNFSMFLLFAPLYWLLNQVAARGNSVLVSSLALLGSFVAVVVAFSQVFFLGVSRAAGTASDPIWSAGTAIVIGFVAFSGTASASGYRRSIFVLGPLLAIITTLLSGSRGPLIAFPLLLAIFAVQTIRYWRRNILFIAGVFVCIGAIGVMQPMGFNRISALPLIAKQLFQGDVIKDASTSERILMYGAGLRAFRASPIIGHGWSHKMEVTAQYLPDDFAVTSGIHQHLHNDLLDFMVSGGILGALSYVLLIIAPVVGAVFSIRDSQYKFRITATLVLAISYFGNGITYLMFGYEYHTTLFIALSAILLGFCKDATDPFVERRPK